jgi:hypothetical protein
MNVDCLTTSTYWHAASIAVCSLTCWFRDIVTQWHVNVDSLNPTDFLRGWTSDRMTHRQVDSLKCQPDLTCWLLYMLTPCHGYLLTQKTWHFDSLTFWFSMSSWHGGFLKWWLLPDGAYLKQNVDDFRLFFSLTCLNNKKGLFKR